MSIQLAIKDLNKVIALGTSGVKVENAGLFSVNVSNEDFAATIELNHHTLTLTVSNRHDGETIGMKSHRVTSNGYRKIKEVLMDTYWPN